MITGCAALALSCSITAKFNPVHCSVLTGNTWPHVLVNVFKCAFSIFYPAEDRRADTAELHNLNLKW